MNNVVTMKDLWHLMEKKGKYDQGGKKNNNYKNGTGMYAKRVKGSCNRCGTREGRMVVHHKDSNRQHNAESNNETLCWSCHEKTKSRARGLKVSNKKTKKKCKEGLVVESFKDTILADLKKMVKSGKVKYGTRLTFTGEKNAAQGAGDYKDMKFYFITFGMVYGSDGARLGKSKPKNPAPEGLDPFDDKNDMEFIRAAKTWSHSYANHEIRPKSPASNRPNQKTLADITKVKVG